MWHGRLWKLGSLHRKIGNEDAISVGSSQDSVQIISREKAVQDFNQDQVINLMSNDEDGSRSIEHISDDDQEI